MSDASKKFILTFLSVVVLVALGPYLSEGGAALASSTKLPALQHLVLTKSILGLLQWAEVTVPEVKFRDARGQLRHFRTSFYASIGVGYTKFVFSVDRFSVQLWG